MNNLKSILALVFVIFLFTASARASLSVSPGYVSFGTVEVNGIPTYQTVRIYNYGPDDASLSFYDSCSFEFDITHYSCFGDLKPNQSCSVQISFSPQSAGNKSCSLYVNGGTSFHSVSLNGTGSEE